MAQAIRAVILGCAGGHLSKNERYFFKQYRPCGFILFKRNCENPQQLSALTDELSAIGDDYHPFIMIDQEGGKVSRLPPPHWQFTPSAREAGLLYEKGDIEAALQMTLTKATSIAQDLRAAGIHIVTAPVLDVLQEDAHDVIGSRAFSAIPSVVTALGEAFLQGCRQGGILSVMKHAIGHGRSALDSHHDLPHVTASSEELMNHDCIPFKALARKHGAWMMTAHIVYEAFDKERVATYSPIILAQVIRNHMNFDGVLISDDIGMGALSGSLAERARLTIAAGHDAVLYCGTDISLMTEVCEGAGFLEDASLERMERSEICLSSLASSTNAG